MQAQYRQACLCWQKQIIVIDHELATRTALAAGLGLVAAAGNLLGGYFVVHKNWPRK
jgi:hypothetical protein